MPRRIANRGSKRRTRKKTARKSSKKKYAKRAKVTNRRIASVASTKKQDTFRGATFPIDRWVNNDALVPCDTGNHVFIWCPSNRVRDPDENQRNRQTVFIKGIYDRWRFTTTDSSVWTWRRIVFRTRNRYGDSSSYSDTKTYFRNLQRNQPQAQTIVEEILTGVRDTDWADPYLAKLDRRAVDVVYDRVRYVRPKGEKGDLHIYDHYIPINRNLTYDDFESGGGENSSPWASNAKDNMGNIYIVDIMKSNNNTGAQLRIGAEATFYWHEK